MNTPLASQTLHRSTAFSHADELIERARAAGDRMDPGGSSLPVPNRLWAVHHHTRDARHCAAATRDAGDAVNDLA